MTAAVIAAVYARYSSDMQRDTSISDQIATARRYADSQGWQVLDAHIYTDAAVSGASLDRPGIRALRATMLQRPRPWDVLLVEDSSRISRNLADAVRFLEESQYAGVRVIFTSQQIDSTQDQAETLIAFRGLIDSQYLKDLSKKVKRGLAGQLDRGFATGSSTYGYTSIDVPDPSGKKDSRGYPASLGKRIEVDPDQARVIVQIFELAASGLGALRIVERLNEQGSRGPRGGTWKCGAVKRVLANERYIGRQIWGQRVHDRRPGSRQRRARAIPREQWHVRDRPELRIISDDLWRRVQERREQVRRSLPLSSMGTGTLMRGRSALHSKHLFVGFMRCGLCGGAVTVMYGRPGMVRYGCSRSHRNGVAACVNRLTVRAALTDEHLLAGVQEELLQPATVRYITSALTASLNRVIDERPRLESELRTAREQAAQRLQRLIEAIESGIPAQTLTAAIAGRQSELEQLDTQLASLSEPLAQRLAIIPSWVEKQLCDVVDMLSENPERVKTEFLRLRLRVVMQPVYEEGPQPFYRAIGEAELPCLAGIHHVGAQKRQTVDRSLPESAGSLPWRFQVDLPHNQHSPHWRKRA